MERGGFESAVIDKVVKWPVFLSTKTVVLLEVFDMMYSKPKFELYIYLIHNTILLKKLPNLGNLSCQMAFYRVCSDVICIRNFVIN